MRSSLAVGTLLALTPLGAWAAKASLPDPLFATYWGQSSSEKSLKEYCATGYFNVISIGFIDQFGDNPIDFQTDGCTGNLGSSAECSSLASQITSCQSAGVKILVSLGGGTVYDCGSSGCTGNYTFVSEAQAQRTGTQLWQAFFNSGTSTKGVWRPFGDVVIDGIDLDIEMVSRYNNQNPQLYYGTLINTLLGYDADIIIGAAPECQWGSLGENPLAGVVTEAPIDFLFVQFFNNAKCSYTSANFDSTVAHWAAVAAANSKGDTRFLVGLPGSTSSALSADYFASSDKALSTIAALRSQYPTAHVGVGVWDAAASTQANWAKDVAKGLAALPAVSAAAASSGTVAASSGLPSVVGNATSIAPKGSKPSSATSGGSSSLSGAANAAAASAGSSQASQGSNPTTSTSSKSSASQVERSGSFLLSVLAVTALVVVVR